MSIIRHPALAKEGLAKIDWVKSYMPVLTTIEKKFSKEKPFRGLRISMSIHLEAKTAYLATVLKAAGAEVAATGCNVLSTQDDVAAGLATLGVEVYAWHGATESEYKQHLKQALSFKPHLMIDDGGDFVNLLHDDAPELASDLIGGCEETTTGIMRLLAREKAGKLNFPMVAVNNAQCKNLFDNRYGTGQSTWDAIMHTTNLMVTGKTVVVAGYGLCGRGIAMRAKGLGANVIITEIDPVKALEASMEGYRVMPMDEAAPLGDVFITVTGCNRVIRKEHFLKMKNGVLLSNAGHFDVEVDKNDLASIAKKIETRKPNIQGYYLEDGRILNLLAEGRLVNLASGNGHPAEIMDMSFSIQSLSLEYLSKYGKTLGKQVISVPAEIDEAVAQMKLSAVGIKIDHLTEAQRAYIQGV